MSAEQLFLAMVVAAFGVFIITLGGVSTINLLSTRGRR